MNLGEMSFYIENVHLDNIYNFVVETIFIWNYLLTNIIDVIFRSNEPNKFLLSGQHIFRKDCNYFI
jgi:hypothetical protein